MHDRILVTGAGSGVGRVLGLELAGRIVVTPNHRASDTARATEPHGQLRSHATRSCSVGKGTARVVASAVMFMLSDAAPGSWPPIGAAFMRRG
jgi:NAD(P)-dependent dehydrogenase (short-subunit alcohol dehydrogenase family)